MVWEITYDDVFDEWDSSTDVDEDAEIRIAVLAFILSWKEDGPPEDADYDPETGMYECPAPGTPVLLRYAISRRTSTPTVLLLDIK
jgi:hypothetical protein